MEKRYSERQIREFYNSARVMERVTKVNEGLSRSGEDFRREMAVSALENLPNPGAIEKYAITLEDVGLSEEARKLRLRYKGIQEAAQGDLETLSEE